jgi:hypothetical protein
MHIHHLEDIAKEAANKRVTEATQRAQDEANARLREKVSHVSSIMDRITEMHNGLCVYLPPLVHANKNLSAVDMNATVHTHHLRADENGGRRLSPHTPSSAAAEDEFSAPLTAAIVISRQVSTVEPPRAKTPNTPVLRSMTPNTNDMSGPSTRASSPMTSVKHTFTRKQISQPYGVTDLAVLADTSFAKPLESSVYPHIHSCMAAANTPTFHLELLSRNESVQLTKGNRHTLDQPMNRIGTQTSCEIHVSISKQNKQAEAFGDDDESEKAGKQASHAHAHTLPPNSISRIHCMLFASLADKKDADTNTHHPYTLTVVDNNTPTGTYVIAANTQSLAVRVPTKASAGLLLHAGDLLCVGVCIQPSADVNASDTNPSNNNKSKQKHKFPPPVLTALEASSAAIVFRVRCLELEK